MLNLLVECPWWVSVVVSGVTFLCLRYVLPSIDFGGVAANSFAKGLSRAAPGALDFLAVMALGEPILRNSVCLAIGLRKKKGIYMNLAVFT